MVEGTRCLGSGWMGIATDLERGGWRDRLFRVSLDGYSRYGFEKGWLKGHTLVKVWLGGLLDCLLAYSLCMCCV